MRYAVTLTLNSNAPHQQAPVRPLYIAAQERTTVTSMIAAAIGVYARDYNVDPINVGFSQRWKEEKINER